MKVAPSIMAADFSKLSEEIKSLTALGADIIHLDVMDAHFVPNLTFGPVVIEGIRKLTELPLDAHLMITDPDKYLEDYINAGCDMISFHLETLQNPVDIIQRGQEMGVKMGIAINPPTPVEKAIPYIERIDYILVMSVNPGFYGQKFIPETLGKVEYLRKHYSELTIEMDGGINGENAPLLKKAGVDIVVSGAYFFRSKDRKKALTLLRG